MANSHHIRVLGIEALSKLPPISGWEDVPLVTLPVATEGLPVKNIKRHAQIALEVGEDYKEDHPDDPRTPDQLGSVHLYTQGWAVVEHSLYAVLNATLSDRNRAKLKVWFLFIKLLMTALALEPMFVGNVWRGVRADIGAQYVKGKKVRWWRFSSCTTNGDVLNNDLFLGTTGKRTVFSIDCKTGVKVKHLSAYEQEDEVLLAAGTRFLVANTLTNGDLTIVNLKEVESGLPVSEDIPPEPEGGGGAGAGAPKPIETLAALSEATGVSEGELIQYTDAELDAGFDELCVSVFARRPIKREIQLLRELSDQQAKTAVAEPELEPLHVVAEPHAQPTAALEPATVQSSIAKCKYCKENLPKAGQRKCTVWQPIRAQYRQYAPPHPFIATAASLSALVCATVVRVAAD